MRNNTILLFLCMLFFAFITQGTAQVKLAQTGFQFLSVGADARATSMGDAFTTVEGTSSALFYNPSGMASQAGFIDVAFNRLNWIADINYNAFSLSFNPADGQYGVFGFTGLLVDYGEVQGTMVWGNYDGFIDTEIIEPKAYAFGLGYAKNLTNRFAVGGQIRYVGQYLGKSIIPEEGVKKNLADALSFDFGTLYRTGYKSLTIGMSVRNFSQEIKFEKEGFQLPLTFKMGISIDATDLFDQISESHDLIVSLDAAHPRSFSEYINFGTEYVFLKTFAVRLGYISSQNEYGFTAGFGIQQFGFGVDYSYTPFGVFGNVNRFTIRYTM